LSYDPRVKKSGKLELNQQPPGPKPGALSRLSYSPLANSAPRPEGRATQWRILRRARAQDTLFRWRERQTLKQSPGAASTAAVWCTEPSVQDSTTPWKRLADKERFELSSPTLTGSRSTVELPASIAKLRKRDLNPRPTAYEAVALPLSYSASAIQLAKRCQHHECEARESNPQNFASKAKMSTRLHQPRGNPAGEIRTHKRRILSPLPLPIRLQRVHADERTRTSNKQALDLLPLPDWATPANGPEARRISQRDHSGPQFYCPPAW
jgi:hypothetical protein